MGLNQIFSKVDREVVDGVQRLHVGAQVYRFLRVALFAFVASLPLTIDTRTLGWGALGSLGAGALETAFRQLYPAFPLDKATGVVTRAVKDQATALATAAINEHVDNYQANALLQKTVSQLLASSSTSVTGAAPAPAVEPSVAVPVANTPAAS